MEQFIMQHAIEIVFSFAVGIISVRYESLKKKINKKQLEQDAIKTAMIAMLHDRLFQQCNTYLAKGFIPVDDAEEILDNIDMLYDAYHTLGGNGTGTILHDKIRRLKIKKEEN